MARIASDVTALIGHTPLVALREYSRERGLREPLLAKVEAMNPGGSAKDRVALAMIEAAERFEDYQLAVAGAPAIDDAYYEKFISGKPVTLVRNKTYPLLAHSAAALVTSGTATLETALFDVPQVVCYETPLPKLIRFAFDHIIQVRYISLVNLIADKVTNLVPSGQVFTTILPPLILSASKQCIG